MNKKGVELPQNFIIVAIIALVVLVIILAFFAGGTASIGQRFSGIFKKSVDDRGVAISFCQNYCSTASTYSSDSQKAQSKYCTESFILNPNEPDAKTYCYNSDSVKSLDVACPGVQEDCAPQS